MMLKIMDRIFYEYLNENLSDIVIKLPEIANKYFIHQKLILIGYHITTEGM
jgi:hypothetical protein